MIAIHLIKWFLMHSRSSTVANSSFSSPGWPFVMIMNEKKEHIFQNVYLCSSHLIFQYFCWMIIVNLCIFSRAWVLTQGACNKVSKWQLGLQVFWCQLSNTCHRSQVILVPFDGGKYSRILEWWRFVLQSIKIMNARIFSGTKTLFSEWRLSLVLIEKTKISNENWRNIFDSFSSSKIPDEVIGVMTTSLLPVCAMNGESKSTLP